MNKEKTKEKTKKTGSKVITGLRSKDVIELIDALENIKLDFDHLHYYERTGLIVPGIRKGQGKGKPKLYSVEDIIILRWLVSLQRNGISIQRFRDIIKFLKEKMPDAIKKPQNYVLITDGTSIQFFDKVSAKALDVLKDTGQYLFVFPVGKIIETSEAAIKKIKLEG
jgi:DNA-binding transcriptional MerR regulator